VPLPAGLVKAILWATSRAGLSEHGPDQVNFLRYRPVLANRRLKEEFGFVPKLSSEAAFELYAKAKGLMQ
jgi:UDP-glucose 4-epimerase